MAPRKLGVRVDGELLAEGEARALWERFSAHMEAHHRDLGGFAEAEGFASIQPQMEGGHPILVASRSAAQGPYVSAALAERSGNGSPRPQAPQKNRTK